MVASAIWNEEQNKYKLSVKPTLEPQTSFLATTVGWEMSMEVSSDIYGTTYYKMFEREPISTAAAMFRDAVQLVEMQ